MKSSDPFLAVAEFAAACERLRIPYVIGGSIASMAYGEPRLTLDVDVAIALNPLQVDAFAIALSRDFYVDPQSIADAVRTTSSFNANHKTSWMRVDVYVRANQGHFAEELRRARPKAVLEDPDATAMFCSAEDIVLQKLRWYRSGGEVSERQWRDVAGVLKRQGQRIDVEYVLRWSTELGVRDLAERALREAGFG